MPRPPRVLVVGTADTKADELRYLSERIAAAGGVASTMDVGVLGTPPFTPDVRNVEVAAAAGTTTAARDAVRAPVERVEVDAHVNDAAFCEAVLGVFDRWVGERRVARGRFDQRAR